MQWFAVYTKPQKEAWSEENIRRIGFETFLPLIIANGKQKKRGQKLQSRFKPLFPRYLFVQFDLTSDYWMPVRYARGVVRLVSFGEPAIPIPIPEEIVKEIRSRQNSEGFIQLGQLSSDLSKGDRIRVINGSLRGIEGLFIETLKDKERVIVLLNLLRNQPIRAHLDRGQIVKV